MCGRFTLIQWEGLAERFGIRAMDYYPRYNIAPGQTAPVIIGGENPQLHLLSWGFEFSREQGEKKGYRVINARAETLEKKSFRHDLQCRRCLVPADGFYEWAKEKGNKVPYRYSLKNGKLFAFAGLWRALHRQQENEEYSFCLITTAANDLVKGVHDRMPVILATQDEKKWLDTKERNIGKLKSMLVPYTAAEMEVSRASMLVNNTKNEGPALLVTD